MKICAITQVTPLGVSSCDAEASSSGMTAARMVPARTSALCMSTEDSFKVPDLDFVFADKCVLVDVSGTDPLDGIRHDVAGVPGHAESRFGRVRRRQAHQEWVMAAN